MRSKLIDTLLYQYVLHLKRRDLRQTDLRFFDPSRVRSILLVLTTGMGDAILSTPAMRAARENFPDSRIVLFTKKLWMDLFAHDPYLDAVIPYYGKYRRFFSTMRALRQENFDLVLVLHGNDPDMIPMAYLSGAPFVLRIPNDTTRFRFLLSNREEGGRDYFLPNAHCIVNRLRVLDLIGAKISTTRLHLGIDIQSERTLSKKLEGWHIPPDTPLIGVQTTAADLYKMWSGKKYAELTNRLLAEFPRLNVLFTGSKKDIRHVNRILEGVPFKARTINAAGRITLQESAALMKRFVTFLTPDTGPFHMAVALGVPTLGLFAATAYWSTGAYQDQEMHRAVEKGRTCDPCVTKRCHESRCMDQIQVDEVFEVLREMVCSGMKARRDGTLEVAKDGIHEDPLCYRSV